VKRLALLALAACAAKPQPAPAPAVTTSVPLPPPVIDVPDPNVEKVPIIFDRPAIDWKPPKDNCPTGVDEFLSAHVKLGEKLELGKDIVPVLAMGPPEILDVLFDRHKKTVTVVARKMGLVYVLYVNEASRCSFVGVSSGY